MRLTTICSWAIIAALFTSCQNSGSDTNQEEGYQVEQHTDANGFSYETVSNDPTGLRLYTLDNGLKVYLGKNNEEPKIQTLVAVRAGSTYDPADNTGLAHYLEHMVFKGTDEIGTSDYANESVMLKEISDLYEAHKKEADPEKKKEIYKKIDAVSQEASKLAIANEYDKMVNSLGAQGTNAFTSTEETVYVNKIPANELTRWLHIESERFGQLVLRLFHTELEAVYEEFNRGQDSDGRKQYTALLQGLYPEHPYGTQTTIGTSEHLKNPSMEAIHEYFNTYYVPNNMAVILVGDLDFDKTIQAVNDSFGTYASKEVTHPTFAPMEPIASPVTKEVFGPTAESIYLGFRSEGRGSEQEVMLGLVDYLLANSSAGLIDLNLNQKQLVQQASSYTNFDKDYGFHLLYGYPKEGQSLDEVRDLLLAQIEKVKKGEFEDWLIEAVINDLRKSQITKYENASAVAYSYLDAYIDRQNWSDELAQLDKMKGITKEQVVAFANKFYGDNYVAVYKRKGEDKNIAKVQNPPITPVALNRDKESAFLQEFMKMEASDLQPQFIDYKERINKTTTADGMEVAYITNESNDLFELNFIVEVGVDHDKAWDLATDYVQYLGTDKYTSEQLQQEFYKIGIDYSMSTSDQRTFVRLSGLKENLDAGLALIEHFLQNMQPDKEAYDKLVASVLKSRANNKTQKGYILQGGLVSYAQYGEDSRLRDIYSSEELKAMNPQSLVDLLKSINTFPHKAFYYGKDHQAAVAALDKHHQAKMDATVPEKKEYKQLATGNKVYYVDYDMVQAEVMMLAKADPFNPEKMAAAQLFNTYFGSGLSSIVFQEIRESKSLAYSAYASYSTASRQENSDYVFSYIGTQANKLPLAVDAMMELMTNMPEAKEQFEQAKEATLKKMAARRITKSSIFWNYERMQRLGLSDDHRKNMYETIKGMTFADLSAFFNQEIKGNNYTTLVIGNKKDLDMDALQKLGEVEEMQLDDLFNYR